MSNKLVFSIITICFNSGKTIERTIKSVLAQDYKNYEYIIIDGCSTDNTLNIIERYKEKFNGRLKYISEKDSGIYNAINKGIKLSKGEIIGIINSDDFYERDCLRLVSEELEQTNNNQIYYGLCRHIDEYGNEKRIVFNNINYLDTETICHPSSFVCKDVYNLIGLYSEDFKIASDYDFFLRAKTSGKIEFVPIYKILANFSIGGISNNHSSVVKCMKEVIKIKKKYGIYNFPKYLAEKVKFIIKGIYIR